MDRAFGLVLRPDACAAFLSFQSRQAGGGGEKPSDRDCDKARDELQKEFEEAYIKITELVEDAKDRSGGLEECLEEVTVGENVELVALISQREQATKRVEVATAEIS